MFGIKITRPRRQAILREGGVGREREREGEGEKEGGQEGER